MMTDGDDGLSECDYVRDIFDTKAAALSATLGAAELSQSV